MTIQFLPFFTGILGAMAHVLSGPDHLAAVTPFAIEEKRKAWKIGLFWGAGHITGMLLIGIIFSIFKDYIPLEKVSGYSEFIVGFILIGIGIWAITKALKLINKTKHIHIHTDKSPFIHTHEHGSTSHSKHSKQKEKIIATSNSSAYIVGTIHGFAGIAHFILFLPVLGLTSNAEIFGYIFGFAIGTIIAMTLFAIVIGETAVFFKHSKNKNAFKYLRLVSGVLAIIIGIYWIIIA